MFLIKNIIENCVHSFRINTLNKIKSSTVMADNPILQLKIKDEISIKDDPLDKLFSENEHDGSSNQSKCSLPFQTCLNTKAECENNFKVVYKKIK